ncbi:MAG: hypothetical protein ACOVP1_08920 [Bacteroidia bacterium]
MKLKILVLFNFLCMLALAQEKTEPNLSGEIQKLRKMILNQREEIRLLEEKNTELSNKLNEISVNLDQKLIRNLELQAQNERAINITLDEFSQKFKVQNQTVEGVKSALDKQLFYQIIFYAIGLIVFIIILLLSIKISTKKALAKQEQNWNQFNEHIFRQ